jgi:3-hydroxyisobutyrate dehydrogenase
MTETIAVLGAGTMGEPMARNLMNAGFGIQVWNRTRSKTANLERAGATVANTPTDAVRGASMVVTMLYDEQSIVDALGDALDQLGSDALWLQMTTVGLTGAERLQTLADSAGVTMIDSPVVGTKAPAQSGKLTVLAAGPQEARQRCDAVFDAVGERTVWVDAPQGGQRLKLVANGWTLTVTEAIAEALRLATGLGIDPGLFVEAITGTATDQPYAHIKAKLIIDGDFTPSFALDNALKDAHLILESAAVARVDIELTEVVERQLEQASGKGHGHEDISAISLA